MRCLLLATLVACSSSSTSPATHTASPTPSGGEPTAPAAADSSTDGWTCFEANGETGCRDSKAGCEYERDKVSGASACVRVSEAWCYEHGEEDDLGVRQTRCVRTQGECSTESRLASGSECEKRTLTATERLDELKRRMEQLEASRVPGSDDSSPAQKPAASTPAPSGYSCYSYYNKMAQLTDTLCVAAASCEADQKAKLDSKLATNPTPCKPASSVWCFPFGKDMCFPSNEMCQQRRESRLRDKRSADNECTERH